MENTLSSVVKVVRVYVCAHAGLCLGSLTVKRRWELPAGARQPFSPLTQLHGCGSHAEWCVTHMSRTRSARGHCAPPPTHGSSLSLVDASLVASAPVPGQFAHFFLVFPLDGVHG